MDYRKPAIFGENWSRSRYRVLPYFAAEKAVLGQPGVTRLLEIGCANGWNMSRFQQYGRRPVGLDVAAERVQLARAFGPVLVASGLETPLAPCSFDAVYIQHVLHHIGDAGCALQEAKRLLRPGGLLFLVETVEDNLLIRWGRRLHPRWMGDEINARFSFRDLQERVADAGFRVMMAEQYSVLFWLWETLPDQMAVMEKFTPLFVAIERPLLRLMRRYGAHCYLVATKV